jgi:hypothetical protein
VLDTAVYIYGYYYGAPASQMSLPLVISTFHASDRNNYTVVVPGLGTGQFSASQPLTLLQNNVTKLGAGTISTTDPSTGSFDYLWVGKDSKNSAGLVAGAAINLSDTSVVFSPEPKTRVIVLDIRKELMDWSDYYYRQCVSTSYGNSGGCSKSPAELQAVLARAKKLAILSLQSYVSPSDHFNVVIAGTTVSKVFNAPVSPTAANLATAYAAIENLMPCPTPLTLAALQTAIAEDEQGITILVSDLYQPADAYTYTTDYVYTQTQVGKNYDSLMNAIGGLFKTSKNTLFLIGDDYQLGSVASASGGFTITGMMYDGNVPFKYEVVDGKRTKVPQMPNLFGSSSSGMLSALNVTSPQLTDVGYTTDCYSNMYGPYYGRMMFKRAALAKSAKMVLPSYDPNNSMLRVVGKSAINNFSGQATFTVTGKLGGLCFSKTFTAKTDYLPLYSDVSLQADQLWASQTAEMLNNADPQANFSAIKELGKEYHIVTPQTSLIALEPGMTLWNDTVTSYSTDMFGNPIYKSSMYPLMSVGDAMMLSARPTINAPAGVSEISIDGYSVNEVITGIHAESSSFAARAQGVHYSLKIGRSIIALNLTGMKLTSSMSVELFDMQGRLVAQNKTVDLHALKAGAGIVLGEKSLGNGYYTVRLRSGSEQRSIKVSIMGR